MNYTQILRKDLCEELESKYEILDSFVMISGTPENITQWCDRWKNFIFSSNQRLIIINDDVDFYIHTTSEGFGNYNFFKCCQYFDIPTDYILYVTTHVGIHKEVFNLCNRLNLSNPTVIETYNFSRMMPKINIQNIGFNENLIDRVYIFPAGTQRNHRVILLCQLAQLNILDQGHISYHFDNRSSINNTEINTLETQHNIILRTTTPWSASNDELTLSKQNHKIWADHAQKFLNQKKQLTFDEITFNKGKAIHQHQPKFLQHGLINLIAETYFDFPYPALSEKTFKSIFTKRGFIIAGPPRVLDTIHNLGFKTFDNLWDESYNTIEDPSLRLDKITQIVNNLCQLNAKQLKEITEEIKLIAEQNFQHYINVHQHKTTTQWY
jgi:hypothetical protein